MPRNPKLSQKELDDAFDSFMKESISDDSLDSARLNKLFEKAKDGRRKNEGIPWWMQKEESDDEPESSQSKVTSLSTNRWMKPKKQSTPLLKVAEEDDEEDKSQLDTREEAEQKEGPQKSKNENNTDAGPLMKKYSETMNSTKESTYSDPLEESGTGSYGGQGSLGRPGAETLEEMEDKARFFKQLEDKHGGDVDYGVLNRAADTLSTMKTVPGAFMGTADDLSTPAARQLKIPEEEDSPDSAAEAIPRQKPVVKVPSDKVEMLAKVSLMETGDSTLNIPEIKRRSKEGSGKRSLLEREDSLERGFAASGTASEMEALHAAMREAANTPTLTFGSKDFNASDQKHGAEDRDHYGTGDDGSHDVAAADEASRKKVTERTVEDIIKEVMQEKMKKDSERLAEQEESLKEANTNNSGNQSQRNSLRDRKEQKGVNLSPVFTDVEPRTGTNESHGSVELGGRLPLQDEEEDAGVYESTDGPTQKDVLTTEDGRTGYYDNDDASSRFASPKRDVGDADDEGARGFDLQPADLSWDQRGLSLVPAVSSSPPADRTDADDEKSTSSRIPISRKGSVSDSNKKRKPKYSNVKSSGYGPKKKPKPREDGWSPADKILQQTKGVKPLSTQVLSKHLMKSVESFATYIQENYADQRKLTPPPELKFSQEEPILSASLRDIRVQPASRERALVAEVNEWQNQWKDERRLNAKLKAEIAAVHREHTRKMEELRLEHEKEVHKLKQDNFVLLAKLNSQDDTDAARKRLQASSGDKEDIKLEERAVLMQKEIMEQETLLQGYQQENERLYKELKKLQEGNKLTEEKMFMENQRLQTQVGNLREVIEGKDLALRNKGVITGEKAQSEIAAGNTSAALGAGRIAELQTEVAHSEVQQSHLKQKTRLLEQTNQELRGHIDQLIREKKHLEEKVDAWREVKQREFQNLQSQHQQEVEGLKKKLKWYSENQELLDKDSIALREKDATIDRLKEELEKRNKEFGAKTTDAQRRAKERAADAKRIQDLERQVKEMNGIIRKRHPNSIPALMFAAAESVGELQVAPGSPLKSNTAAFLEERVEKLESELDKKDEDVKRLLRTMEQKNSNMKIQYEERIKELEARNQQDRVTAHPHPTISSLERELEGAKERFHKEIDALRQENNKLKTALSQRRREENKDNGEERRAKEKELKEHIMSLERELENKAQEIDMLKSACNKLMEQKLQEGKELKKPKKASGVPGAHPVAKIYEPETFAGSHISDVLVENETLRRQIEVVKLEAEEQRISQQAATAEAESALRKVKEENKDTIRRLEGNHKAEVEALIAEKALVMADSDGARLKRQVESQKLMIEHLQYQLSESQVTSDLLAAARVKEQLQKTQMEQLRAELEDAKKNHTPEMRHFESLQAKIVAMENRKLQRESDIERMVEKAAESATAEKRREIQQYRDLVMKKNLEIERFRAELDSILDVLRELQKQGVVLPGYRHKEKQLL